MKIRALLSGQPFMTEYGIVGYSTVVLVESGEVKVLYDAGQRGCALHLTVALAEAGLAPADVTHVVVSHLHFDHVGNLPLFDRAQICLSKAEWQQALEAPDEWHCRQTVRYLLDEGLTAHAELACPTDDLREHGPNAQSRFRFVKEGDEIAEGIRVLELPGHTRGLIGLLCGEDTVLCSDAVKNRYEFWEDRPLMTIDEAAHRASQRRIRELGRIVYPGHDTVLERDHDIRGEKLRFELLYANGDRQSIEGP